MRKVLVVGFCCVVPQIFLTFNCLGYLDGGEDGKDRSEYFVCMIITRVLIQGDIESEGLAGFNKRNSQAGSTMPHKVIILLRYLSVFTAIH